MDIAIGKSNYPPYGIAFLNDIPNNLPIKNPYSPTPTPFHPIISYRIIPP